MRRPAIVLTLAVFASFAVFAGMAGQDTVFDGLSRTCALAGDLAGAFAAATGPFISRLPGLVANGYLRTPEMIIGLGTALSIPLLALVSASARRLARQRASRLRGARSDPTESDPTEQPRDRGPGPQTRAWLEIRDASGARAFEIGGELLRIGRDVDNDLFLAGPGMQQYHAVIRRTPEAEFVVIDVTGDSGTGITVNGRRLRTCPLQDGDQIEIGQTAVTFHRTSRNRGERPLSP